MSQVEQVETPFYNFVVVQKPEKLRQECLGTASALVETGVGRV